MRKKKPSTDAMVRQRRPGRDRAPRPLAALVAMLAVAGTVAEADRATAQDRVEEIVVTARRRAEMLEDTPISITAIGATQLREAGATRLDDVQALVPNLVFTTPDDGVAADVRIRGIGSPQNVSVAFDPGVGVYVDGVFMPRTIGALIDIIDVEQIEVLRGPQGTLFGKNTVGGAINITTAKPGPELEGSVLVRPGNFDSVHSRATISGPILEDRLFGRLAVSQTRNGGYVYNSFRDEHVSNRDFVGVLASVRALPTDDITIDLAGTWSREHNDGRGGQCIFLQPGGLGSLTPGLEEACRQTGPYRTNSEVDQLIDVESRGAWGTIAWEIGEQGPFDDVELKFISSWREQRPRIRVDVDGTSASGLTRSAVGGPGILDGEGAFQRQFSTEGQVNATAWEGRIHVIAGAFGFWEEARERTTVVAVPAVVNIANDSIRVVDNWTWALFGQATVDVTDWASVTAGVRYTEDKKGLLTRNETSRPPLEVLLSDNGSAIFTAWTPMASLALTAPEDWLDETPIDHLMTYFTYSRGFRGGGFNGTLVSTDPNPFKPEFLDSFEVGMKTIAFEQRATFSINYFYGDYSDIQVTTVRDLGDTNGDGAPDFTQQTLNAAKATTQGIEAEFLLLPAPWLRINGSVGWLDATYDEFVGVSDIDSSPIDRSGQRFNRAPEWQTHLGIQAFFPVELGGPTWADGVLSPRVDWSYQSEMRLIGPEVESALQTGYNLLNARLSYTFWDDQLMVALWAQNLLDENRFDSVTPIISSYGVTTRFFQMPRTYGGEIRYSF